MGSMQNFLILYVFLTLSMDEKNSGRQIKSQETFNREILRIENLQKKVEDLYEIQETSVSLIGRWAMTGLALEPFRFERLDLTKDEDFAIPEPNGVIIQDFEAKLILNMLVRPRKEEKDFLQNPCKDSKYQDEKQIRAYISWEDVKTDILAHLQHRQRNKKEKIQNPCKNLERQMSTQQELRFQALQRLQNPFRCFSMNLQSKEEEKEKDSLIQDERIEQFQNTKITVTKYLKKVLGPIAMFAFYECVKAIKNKKIS